MTKQVTTPPWLVSLVEEHFDELQMLFELRDVALRDADYGEADIRELDERIESHFDALVLADEAAWPILLAGLNADRLPALAATLVMLRQGERAANAGLAAMETAEGPALTGIGEGLCHSRIDFVSGRLKDFYENGSPALAATAAEVFACHRRLTQSASRLGQLLDHSDPLVRTSAWRIVALIDG